MAVHGPQMNITYAPPKSTSHGHGSLLAVSVGGRRVFLQPAFQFASSLDDKTFIEKLSALESDMPFTPRDDFYYAIEPKKSGKGLKMRKLHKGWKNLA